MNLLKTRPIVLAAAALLAVAGHASAQCGFQHLLASDKAAGDNFGYSLATTSYGGVKSYIMGAPFDDNARGTDAGAVYSFSNSNGNQTWNEYAKITPPYSLPNGFFGASVGLHGAEAIISAEGAARVFFYQRTGNVWNFHKEWLGSSSDAFGKDVAMDGSVAVCGAPFTNIEGQAGAGRIHIYERDANFSWHYTGILAQESFYRNGSDWMGWSVATNGTQVMAGAPRGDTHANKTDTGWVLVCAKVNNLWARTQTIFAPDSTAGDRFGTDVAMDGNWAVIGAPNATVDGKANAGLAYIYYYNGTSWSHAATIKPYPVYSDATFGTSVSIKGDLVSVTSPGKEYAYVFRKVGFSNWPQIARYTDPDSGTDTFAKTAVVDIDRVLIADPGNDPSGLNNAGAAYHFRLNLGMSDSCEGAMHVTQGDYYTGCTTYAVLDGGADCQGLSTSPDVYHKITADKDGSLELDTFGSSFNTVLSIHDGCPTTSQNTLACNDDFSPFELNSRIIAQVKKGVEYTIRIGGAGGERGFYVLSVGEIVPNTCYADFNQDGVLNTLDFLMFLNAWTAQENAADFNDDGVVNTLDVLAYLNAYNAGC